MIALSSQHWRIVGYCVAGLALLLFVLFVVDQCSSIRSSKDIDKRKANINAHIANINAIKSGKIQATKEELAAEKMAANIETKALLEDIAASEEARAATNAALANLEAAKNVNTTNSSVRDLEKALERLQ